MRKIILTGTLIFLIVFSVFIYKSFVTARTPSYTETEPGFGPIAAEDSLISDVETDSDLAEANPTFIDSMLSSAGFGNNQYSGWGRYWAEFTPEEEALYKGYVRPPGPPRVGLQVGHWKLNEVPDELSGLRSSGGASGGGKSEWEVVHAIAEKTKALLEAEGVVVDLLPATVPVDYSADAFVSIHADGNTNPSVSGFKMAAPRRDFSERAAELVDSLYVSYERNTGLKRDRSITRRMTSYYAFNWRRYDHAVHPMTPAVIIETGFLSSPSDREIIVNAPEKAAQGIADGIMTFLGKYNL